MHSALALQSSRFAKACDKACVVNECKFSGVYFTLLLHQDEKERLKGRLTAASQDSHTNPPQLQEKHTFIASLQVSDAQNS